MNLYRITLFFLQVILSEVVLANYNDIRFLHTFFSNKNVMLTCSFCWKSSKIRSFLNENLMSSRPKQIAIFNNEASDKFFQHLAADNVFVLDLRNCKASENLFKMVGYEGLFRYNLKYLLLISNDDSVKFLNILKSFPLFPISDVTLGLCEVNSDIQLYQTYKMFPEDEDIVMEQVGNWTAENGLTELYKTVPIIKRRYDFKKKLINVACIVFSNESFKHFEDFRYPMQDTYFKQDFPTIHTVLQYLNFSYNLRPFDKFGYYNEVTKEWDGVINDLKSGYSDISGGSIFFNLERFEVVDFLKRVSPMNMRFLLKKPSTSYIRNIYYMTFTGKVWLATLTISIIFMPILYAMLKWEFENNINKKLVNLKQRKYSVSDVTLITLEALCQQGTTTEPASFTGKTVTLVLFCAFMFLYVAYSAYILVLLQSTIRINKLSQLLESRIEVGGLKINYMKHYFEAPQSGVLRDLYRKKIYPNQYFPFDVGMKKVQDGNFAFHVPLGMAYHHVMGKFTNYDICGLQDLRGYTNYEGYVAVPKNSPFKKFFMVGLIKVDENGLQHRTISRTFVKPKCYSHGGNFQSVRFYDCNHVFYMFATGIGMACLTLLAEMCIHRYLKKKWEENKIIVKNKRNFKM